MTRRAVGIFVRVIMLCFAVQSAASAQSTDIRTYDRYVRTGSERLQRGDYRGAREAFQEALRYHDGDAAAYLGLGAANVHLQDDAGAELALQDALRRDPREKRALQMLGDLAYRKDNLELSATYWERALDIDPADAALKTRLERVRRERHAEQDFNRDLTSHFSVKYEGRERIETGRIVLHVLEEAYGEIGRALSLYPDREIAVILYSDQQFRDVTNAPGWSGALYDGKIRIPIRGIERETPALRALLFHEYTHAAVRAITSRVPAWLNEGLAQHFEGRMPDSRENETLRQIQRAGRIPSLRALEGSFLGLSGAEAGYAYLVSLSAVRHLVDQYGMYRIKTILEELAAGSETERALQNALLLSYDDFERGWKRSLE
jgi:tetratricopeptide (TPR) repeat protein